MIITGLYIVKNEEREIKRSIESIMGICDEIVVVDTGSVDNTVETVEALGAKVFHFEWVNDFSKARNFALTKANGDLIIFIDADEWFPDPLGPKDREYLEEMAGKGYALFSILRSNLNNGVVMEPLYNMRMLRGKIGLKYEGAIHESILDDGRTLYLPERFLLYHSGYDGDLVKEKSKRNLELLYGQFENAKSALWRISSCFYIIRENRLLGNIQESLDYIDKFFGIWKGMKKNVRPVNIGLSAYDVTTKLYSELPELVIPNDVYLKMCKDYLRDYPRHPASYFALATYYYTRHGNYDYALEAVSRVEELAEKYRIEDYPHDYVGEAMPRAASQLIKGNIFYDKGERDKAFDCYASILKNTNSTPGFLRRLLSLIRNQPDNDVINFLSAIPPQVTPDYIELLLDQLIYFPSMKDVYLYFTVQHLRMTRKHSYISAVSAIISGESLDLVISVAKQLAESQPLTANALYFLAVMCSNGDRDVLKHALSFTPAERLAGYYLSGESPEQLSQVEIDIIRIALPVALFIGDDEIERRLLAIVTEFGFIFAHMALNYCHKAEDHSRLVPMINVDPDKLHPDNRAAFFMLMGRAFRSMGDYASAKKYLMESFELVPSDVDTYKELRILASVAPVYAKEIYSLIVRFNAAGGSRSLGDESIMQ